MAIFGTFSVVLVLKNFTVIIFGQVLCCNRWRNAWSIFRQNFRLLAFLVFFLCDFSFLPAPYRRSLVQILSPKFFFALTISVFINILIHALHIRPYSEKQYALNHCQNAEIYYLIKYKYEIVRNCLSYIVIDCIFYANMSFVEGWAWKSMSLAVAVIAIPMDPQIAFHGCPWMTRSIPSLPLSLCSSKDIA